MSLPGEDEMYEVGERIKAAAREKDLNLSDPGNEYTLWSDLNGRMHHTKSFGSDGHAAWAEGHLQPKAYKSYVVHGPLEYLWRHRALASLAGSPKRGSVVKPATGVCIQGASCPPADHLALARYLVSSSIAQITQPIISKPHLWIAATITRR